MYIKGYIPWNKDKTIKDDPRIAKLAYWKGKKNPSLSLKMKGRIPWNKGIPCRKETKDKISISKTGKKQNPSWFISIRKNIKNNPNYGMRGKKQSAYAIKKSRERMIGHIPWNKGKEFAQVAGKNHWNWKGGIARLPYTYSFRRKKRKVVLERDKICQLCSQDFDLIVHHIDYNKSNNTLDNLIVLCRKCNSMVNKNRKFYTKLFKDKILQIEKNGLNSVDTQKMGNTEPAERIA